MKIELDNYSMFVVLLSVVIVFTVTQVSSCYMLEYGIPKSKIEVPRKGGTP